MVERCVPYASATSHETPIWCSVEEADHSDRPISSDEMLVRLHRLIDMHHAVLAPVDRHSGDDAHFHRAGRKEALMLAASIGRIDDAVDLELLVRDVLRPFRFGDADGIHIDGPSTWVGAGAGRLLILALHELATNAIKFGALNGSAARHALHIGWQANAQGLTLVWRESGVAILRSAERARPGFGCMFLKTALPALLDGKVDLRLFPGGLQCSIQVPETSFIIDRC